MSAPPSQASPATTPNAVNGISKVIRRRAPADPLVRPKRRPRPPVKANGDVTRSSAPRPVAAAPQGQTPAKTYDGWSKPPGANYRDYPLVTTKREIMDGLRHHVMRLTSSKPIDPRNEDEFTRPVRLHRRDPRAPAEDDDLLTVDSKDGVLDEKLVMLRAERDAQRAVDMAQIAPSAAAQPTQKKVFKKKTQQVFRNDATPEGQARAKLKYEEYLPWHLEDFDNKNSWVGSYESALSETNVMLVMRASGEFAMVPLEKWYKFTSKSTFKSLSIEEAEKRMSRKVKEPRWFMESQKENERLMEEDRNRRAAKRLTLRKNDPGAQSRKEAADADDLDFDEDRFADDEENPVFEGDEEESKMAEQRIKRDQLKANIFDLKDISEFDKEEKEEERERDLEKKHGKGVVRALKKFEGKYEYDSDKDNPYTSSSDSSDLFDEKEEKKDEEKKKEEERKKEEEKKKEDDKKRPKLLGPKGSIKPSRKRPGSPNQSDSGNESSRKKKHKGSRSGTPVPDRPSPGPRKSSIVTLSLKPGKPGEISSKPRRAGSGSDGEGESKRQKITLRLSGSTSPNGSRAGSPSIDRSRLGSPADGTIISDAEVVAAIPSTGIAIKELIAMFNSRNINKPKFIESARRVAYIGPDKLLRPREGFAQR